MQYALEGGAPDDDPADALGATLEAILRRTAYDQLVMLARRERADERSPLAPGTFTLLHDALKRVAGSPAARELSVEQLLRHLCRTMRHLLVDAARHRQAQRRNAPLVDLTGQETAAEQASESLLSVFEAMDELRAFNPLGHRILELRFIAGYKAHEVAEMLATSRTTVNNKTQAALAWLRQRLKSG